MSVYTTELRYVCENFAGYDESQNFPINSVIEKSRTKLFNFQYPIFDENYKSVLESKIIKHFYFREIGFETVAHFRYRLDEKLNLIMPYYNQLYKSELLKFNPLYDVDITTTHNENTTGESTTKDVNNTNSSSKSKMKSFDNYSKNGKTTQDKHTTMDSTENETANKNISQNDKLAIVENNTDVTDKTLKKTGTVGDTTGTENAQNGGQDTDTKSFSGSENVERNTVERYSDTPQGALNGMRNDQYLTNATLFDENVTTTPQNKQEKNVSVKGTTVDKTIKSKTIQDANETEKINGEQNKNRTDTRTFTENDTENINKSGNQNGYENNAITDDESSQSNGTQNNTANMISDSVTDSNNSFKNVNEYITHVSGKNGSLSYSKLLLEFRDTFLNIDAMIIDELEPLFMQIF